MYLPAHDGLILASRQNLLLLASEIQHARRHQAIPCQARVIPSQEDLSLNPEIRSLTEIVDYVRRHLSRATVSPSNLSTTNPRQEVSENRDSQNILQNISAYLSVHRVQILSPRPWTLLAWGKCCSLLANTPPPPTKRNKEAPF